MTSTLATDAVAPGDPVTMRIAASRFSRPQQAYVPAQCEGTCRRYDVTPGAPTAIRAGRCSRIPAANASPSAVSPKRASGPPAIRFAPSRHSERCTCPPLPTPGTATFGENDVRKPCRRPTAAMTLRTSTEVSAAETGSSAATESSS